MYNIEGIWRSMKARCYSTGYPSYEGCTVCDEWMLDYKTFANWFIDNLYNCGYEMLELDKDLFSGERKIYSPETCCLLPKRINIVLAYKRTKWSPLPTGVNLADNGEYIATVYSGHGYIRGTFPTMQEAAEFYAKNKEKNIKRLANVYKPYLPNRIYDALMTYECNLIDKKVTSYTSYTRK